MTFIDANQEIEKQESFTTYVTIYGAKWGVEANEVFTTPVTLIGANG